MQSFDTNTNDGAPSAAPTQTIIVGGIDDLRPGACIRFELPDGNELAIFNVNGEYYATDNFCPHREAALSDGLILGHIVECGWHGWRFDVRTGECLTVTEKIRTFSMRVDNGMLMVEVE